ncbi:MAG: YceI family protein, partial [Hyphomonadaceae bacterium]
AFAAALLLATIAGAASAQSPVAPSIAPSEHASLDPAAAPAGAYTPDARHASVVWRVRHIGLGLYTARFDTIAGTLNFDPQNVSQSSVNVTIAANSVSTGLRNREGALAFDSEIANVLGAQEHPQITFVSRSIQQTSPTTGLITGDLTLNGRTHPVTLEASFHGGRRHPLNQRYVVAFSGRTVIDRTQWGAGSLIFNQFAGDDVEILIDAEFIKDE